MRSSIALGALFLILSEALFAGVGALVKHLSETLNQTQLVFFRNAFALLVLLPFLVKAGAASLKTEKAGLHIFRACCGLIAMYCFFLVLANMPLAPAMMALLMAPFFVPLIARFWLGERVSVKTLFAIGVGFTGVVVMLSPDTGANTNPDAGSFNQYSVLAVLCAVLVATTKCTIRRLSDTEPSLRIVTYFTGLATLISFFPMLSNWQPIAWRDWLLLLLMGGLAAAGQMLMTRAFKLASPVQIGLLTYSSLVFAAAFGYWFWNEPVTLELMLGMILIMWAANMTLRQRWLV